MNIINLIKQNIYKNKVKTLFLIDILYMKDINSVYGFENGDYIIQQLKKLLKKDIKRELIVYFGKKTYMEFERLYVDVFSVEIYNDIDETAMMKVKNIIFNSIITHTFYLLNRNSIDIDITIGCSKSQSKDLRVYAEKALHNAKLNFSNFMFLDAKLFENEVKNINFISVINHNIDERLVEPFLQPIVDSNTHEIHKYEALMRIYDDEGNVISPAVFLDKSRKYRLYTKLMSILIEKVIHYIIKYKISISINLDFNDILNPHIKQEIIGHLISNDIGEYLTIEILESQKISNYDVVNEFIAELKNYNVKIAIDDFGSGYSNFSHILELDVDYLKIDASLIKNITINNSSKVIVQGIVDFSKRLGIKTIAEYVETKEGVDLLTKLGIDYVQGYYIGKPEKDII